MSPCLTLSLTVVLLAFAAPAMAEDAAVTPIQGCGSSVILETGFPNASGAGQESIAEHVPAACV